MSVSVFDLFSVGTGPSSSHTMGPTRACNDFLNQLIETNKLERVCRMQIDLYGSLALTGVGHGTDKAILMGLLGERPETMDPSTIDTKIEKIKTTQQISLANRHAIDFQIVRDLQFHIDKVLACHSNGMTLLALDENKTPLLSETYYSIGGGFIVTEANFHNPPKKADLPYPFSKAQTLVDLCEKNQLSIANLMRANEACWHDEKTLNEKLEVIIDVMLSAVNRGIHTEGILPGGLKVKRRACQLHAQLVARADRPNPDPTAAIDWLSAYAIAVNEENAAGGRVVTAPTNGAAGVIPAVIKFYHTFYPNFDLNKIKDFLLVAGAIAILYKHGASLSAAEVGCQGEIGVASSMAAGALTAVLGGTLAQITNAAEIAMEHHLGMTCDPINGLVQIPCIERNAMGAVKAVNACHLAMLGDGQHHVSLDKVIATMKRTGLDMMTIYKETSLGGLAVNITEC